MGISLMVGFGEEGLDQVWNHAWDDLRGSASTVEPSDPFSEIRGLLDDEYGAMIDRLVGTVAQVVRGNRGGYREMLLRSDRSIFDSCAEVLTSVAHARVMVGKGGTLTIELPAVPRAIARHNAYQLDCYYRDDLRSRVTAVLSDALA